MRTSYPPSATPAWYVVDASGKTLGKLASCIATVLRGKHRPSFSPHLLQSDHVIVTNASGIVLKGKKGAEKVYFRHSGYFGHLKRTPASRILAEHPERIILLAVKGMLPRNNQRAQMLRFLHVFPASDHTHAAQQPRPLESLFPRTPRSSPKASEVGSKKASKSSRSPSS